MPITLFTDSEDPAGKHNVEQHKSLAKAKSTRQLLSVRLLPLPCEQVQTFHKPAINLEPLFFAEHRRKWKPSPLEPAYLNTKFVASQITLCSTTLVIVAVRLVANYKISKKFFADDCELDSKGLAYRVH
jgi:hypothetical protein